MSETTGPIAHEYRADETDNIKPYGTQDFVRTEFGFITNVRANNIQRTFKAGKQSTLIYKAKKDKDALKCLHLYMGICAPCTCAICHSKTLTKYTYTHLYDDRIQTNVPGSLCCWIMDNTRVYYLHGDWAQEFETAGICTPCFTHCSFPNKNFGAVAIGHGKVNFVMNPGARRLAPPLLRSCGCSPQCQGGPFFGECCTFLPCSEDWVCFPFLKDPEDFISKAKEQRAKITEQYDITPGKPVEKAPTDDEDMPRV